MELQLVQIGLLEKFLKYDTFKLLKTKNINIIDFAESSLSIDYAASQLWVKVINEGVRWRLDVGCESHTGKMKRHSTVSSRDPKRLVGTGFRRSCRGGLSP